MGKEKEKKETYMGIWVCIKQSFTANAMHGEPKLEIWILRVCFQQLSYNMGECMTVSMDI